MRWQFRRLSRAELLVSRTGPGSQSTGGRVGGSEGILDCGAVGFVLLVLKDLVVQKQEHAYS